MSDHPHPLVELATSLSFTLGLLALGISTGVQISLMAVQRTVMTTNLVPLEQQAGDLFPVLVEMQTIVNWAGYVAAALLVGGALLTRRDMVSSALSGGESRE